MKIIKAREIEIPDNLPELLDARGGRPEGTFRNIIAERGELHQIKRKALEALVTLEVKKLMRTDQLPGKPMSLRRFSDMFWALSFAYLMGTFKIDEKGSLLVGDDTDIKFVADIMQADKVVFRNGREVEPRMLMAVLKAVTAEDSIDFIWRDIAKKGPMTRKELTTGSALRFSEFMLDTVDSLSESNMFSL